MLWLVITASIIVLLCAAVLAAAHFCWRFAFTVPADHRDIEKCVPEGGKYVEFHDRILEKTREAVKIPYEDVSISSADGLLLHGRLYLRREDAPFLLLFHGYRSFAERDFCECLP